MPALAPIAGLHPLERSMVVRRSAQRIPALRLNDRELRLGNGHEACVLLQMAKQLRSFFAAGQICAERSPTLIQLARFQDSHAFPITPILPVCEFAAQSVG